MTHVEVLQTNLAALAATMERLEARQDTPEADVHKLLEIRIIHDSIKTQLEGLL